VIVAILGGQRLDLALAFGEDGLERFARDRGIVLELAAELTTSASA
jgi:hypothetical protein